jgi:hypothetical protein
MSKRKLPEGIPTEQVPDRTAATTPPRAVVPKGSPADAFLQATPTSPETNTTVNAAIFFAIHQIH